VSYGKERPFCVDQDKSCYQQNRRDHMLLSTR
jgi:peptidoglycan-associated lipoprotein